MITNRDSKGGERGRGGRSSLFRSEVKTEEVRGG